MLRYDHTVEEVIVTLRRKGEKEFEQIVGGLKKFDYRSTVVTNYLQKIGANCTWLQWSEKLR